MTGRPVLPGQTIGVVGGGQLGRMLALEARRMGYRVQVLDPNRDAPAVQAADGHVQAPLDDADAALELARRCDVVTLEWENADAGTVRRLAEVTPVRPGAHVLEVAQHRVREKEAARRLGIPTAAFRAVGSPGDLRAALDELGTPAILKTARGGYDGKGQVVIRSPDDADAAFAALSDGSVELILEAFVPFRMEASVLCARSPQGEIAAFPVVENRHENGILDLSIAPAPLSPALLAQARQIGEALVEGLQVEGLLAVELFVDAEDRLYMNEMAPRPHNSGHLTWEACATSQFEQQLRAVCDLPLGRTDLLRPACMANLLGEHIGTGEQLAGTHDALALPLTSLHLYGKREARSGRKMGHLTVLADDAAAAMERAIAARQRLVRSHRGTA